MNDITKARHFLKTHGSNLQHLDSFGAMLATAEQNYRELKMRKVGNKDLPGTWDAKEVEAALDYAALKYLKKYNQLPKNAPQAFRQGTTLEDKRQLARQWANA
jgi:hypothetical protein